MWDVKESKSKSNVTGAVLVGDTETADVCDNVAHCLGGPSHCVASLSKQFDGVLMLILSIRWLAVFPVVMSAIRLSVTVSGQMLLVDADGMRTNLVV